MAPPNRAAKQFGAEAIVARWELEAARAGLERDGPYWEAGWPWMLAKRR
jgi:hypothetical protein